MLKMRLQRVGRKHEPTFRLLLTDSKNSTKSGRFKEILGSYDPRKSVDQFKTERIKYWLSQGVMPTDTVYNLLVTHKIIEGKKRNVLPKKTVEKKPEAETIAEVKEEPKEEEAKAPVENPAPESEPVESEAEAPDTPTEESQNPEENQG